MDVVQPGWFAGLQQSMCSWTPRSRLLAVSAAIVLTATLAFYFGHMMGDEFQMYDGEYYIMIARGDTASTIQPFAARQLGALVVRALAAVLHTSWQMGFVIEAVISLSAMLLWVFVSMTRTEAPRWLMALSVMLPFWRVLYHGFVLPDLFYSALLCGFLALLEADMFLLAAAFLFPLMLTRESTSLTLVCFLLAGWKRLGWRGSLLAVVATIAGSAVVAHLTANITNREKLPQMVYMLAKVPWNALRLTGIQPWANLYPMCSTPTSLHAVHIGPLRMVGLCPYIPETPAIAISLAISTFGLLPLLAYFLLRARGWRLGESVLLRFVLAPLLGTAYDRLFGYAWPLVLVALPRLWKGVMALPGGMATSLPAIRVVAFCALHLLLAVMSMYGGLVPKMVEALISLLCVLAGGLLLSKYFPQRRGVPATA
jgi:hypothetical protein